MKMPGCLDLVGSATHRLRNQGRGLRKGDEEARWNYSMTAERITNETGLLWLELSRHVWVELVSRQATSERRRNADKRLVLLISASVPESQSE
ncbi:hypothetical protein M513_10901 [Trichuris suis]|uniref:Uncharacterized protein n=1 Tax=Trichuris suis TaxID=68888 RepID=A0A085LT91_9BILA|nr:hypothetical protein M513_10901 [Trichuris suis]